MLHALSITSLLQSNTGRNSIQCYYQVTKRSKNMLSSCFGCFNFYHLYECVLVFIQGPTILPILPLFLWVIIHIFGKVWYEFKPHAINNCCFVSCFSLFCSCLVFTFRFVAEYSKVNKIYLLSTFDGFIFAAIELH